MFQQHQVYTESAPWKIWTKNHTTTIFKSENEMHWESPWYFVQGADPQYGLIERYINKNPVPNWDKEIDLTEKLVAKLNVMEPKPRFFMVCGDLCDAVPTSEPKLYNDQEVTFKRIFAKLDQNIPLFVVSGNHDVGDSPTPEAIKVFNKSWGDDYYSFWCGGIFFVVINSQYYAHSQNVKEEAERHQKWLEQQLSKAEGEVKNRIVMFQHIPWFLHSADEPGENEYFTLGSDIRHINLDRLVAAGVQKVFCGHYHRNAGGLYKDLEVIVSSAIGGQLGDDKSGVRLVKVYKDKIEHQYYSLDDLPNTVQL